MAKKVLLRGLFCSFFIGFFQILAASNHHPVVHLPKSGDLCSAPAPDSFRVASTNGSVILLAWQPISIGAQHTLKVFEKDTSGNWNQIQAFYYIIGGSFDVSSMQYGQEYRFVIATNCNNGETSELNSSIDFINLILDLTLAGRTPNNPTPSEGCPLVNYQINNWVGFSIQVPSSNSSLATKYFEFAEGFTSQGEPKPIIKRTDSNWLVASDEFIVYPIKPAPLVWTIQGSYSFEIYHIKGFPFPYHVGTLEVKTFDPTNKNVTICKKPGLFWDSNYQFKMHTATSGNYTPPFVFENRNDPLGNEMQRSIKEFKVQSPFTNLLNIYFPEGNYEKEESLIQLLNTSGQILISKNLNSLNRHVILPVESIPVGFYILRIEVADKQAIFKVLKVD